MGLPGSVGSAHRIDREEIMTALGQRAHEEHDSVHESPGDVAPDHPDEKLANVLSTGGGRAERAREGERHDQPEEDFGDTRDRIQEAPGLVRPRRFLGRFLLHVGPCFVSCRHWIGVQDASGL